MDISMTISLKDIEGDINKLREEIQKLDDEILKLESIKQYILEKNKDKVR